MNRRSFLLSVLALTGCATPLVAVRKGPGVFDELEPLYDVQVGRRGLTFKVASSGCTSKGDFVFYTEDTERDLWLAFARRRVDRCQAPQPGLAAIQFTWADLKLPGQRHIALLNPTRK